jgi:hypothetical protein
MSKLIRVTTSAMGAALLLGLTCSVASAAAPVPIDDHFTDVLTCGDPDNPDFVVSYEADLSGLAWPLSVRGNIDAAARHGNGRIVETYSIPGHTLVADTRENSRDHTVTVVGDRLVVTVYSSGVSTWSLDGSVISRSSGTLRIGYSANYNGTPNDRSDDFDYVFGDGSAPGSGRNQSDAPDPCAVLAPFAN